MVPRQFVRESGMGSSEAVGTVGAVGAVGAMVSGFDGHPLCFSYRMTHMLGRNLG